jgi:NADH-quinone oxidoreductase subunit L
MNLNLWLIPLLPLAGAAINGLLGKRFSKALVNTIALGFTGAAFAYAVWVAAQFFGMPANAIPYIEPHQTWMAAGSFSVEYGFWLDQLSLVMLLIVSGVGFVIHIFSIGYMEHEGGYYRYFAYLNLFMFFMLTLVLANNYLLMFVGWEGVGLASYLLIGFWFLKPSAANAGKKAFIVNRVGDFGFLIALFLLIKHFGTLQYDGVFKSVASLGIETSAGLLTAIGLLMLMGATGKSAQIPLYVWLPDAMEGPTPVSALIHAATMVTAGVYMVCRSHAIFDRAPQAALSVAVIGTLTAIFAASIGMVQTDIKKVLAYSTVSQLGYMFMGAGVLAYGAGIFHLMTHAFFKGCLFLCSGAIIHGLGGEQDMRFMGGLRKFMPFTFVTFIIGWLAIAGVFPLAGFWAKDEILAKAYFSGNYGLWIVGLVAAVFTAFYMTRQVWLVFYDGERWQKSQHMAEHEDGHAPAPHESPVIMLIPLFVLAGLAMVGAAVDLPFEHYHINLLDEWLAPILRTAPEINASSFGAGFALSTIALVIAIVGIVVGRAIYKNGLDADGLDPGEKRLGALGRVFDNGYYFDIGISRFVSGPVTAAATFLSVGVDRGVIDGAVNGVGTVFRGLGGGLRKIQTGLVRNYALAIVFGAVLLLVFVTTRATL